MNTVQKFEQNQNFLHTFQLSNIIFGLFKIAWGHASITYWNLSNLARDSSWARTMLDFTARANPIKRFARIFI